MVNGWPLTCKVIQRRGTPWGYTNAQTPRFACFPAHTHSLQATSSQSVEEELHLLEGDLSRPSSTPPFSALIQVAVGGLITDGHFINSFMSIVDDVCSLYTKSSAMMRRIFFPQSYTAPTRPLRPRPTLHLPIVTCFLIQSAL